MKLLWCWRCKREVVMLDEQEYEQNRIRKRRRAVASASSVGYTPMLHEYECLTGVAERYPLDILHHRLAIYGPPCRRCGKPLRTPWAKLCGSCMAPVNSSSSLELTELC